MGYHYPAQNAVVVIIRIHKTLNLANICGAESRVCYFGMMDDALTGSLEHNVIDRPIL